MHIENDLVTGNMLIFNKRINSLSDYKNQREGLMFMRSIPEIKLKDI